MWLVILETLVLEMEAFKEDLDWTISSLNASISNTSVSKIIEKASQIVLECMYIKAGLAGYIDLAGIRVFAYVQFETLKR